MSSFINRDLCLETGARFRDYQHRCRFNPNTSENILQDVTTCPNKCNFQIDNLHPHSNSLREINLTIGKDRKMFHSCSRTYYDTDVYLNINCSSWNAREYIIWDDVYACSINDAQCIHINKYCVCHCMPGYIFEGEKCLKMNVSIGGICGFDWQCNGTQFANVCDHGLCSCSSGYIQINRKCLMYHDINNEVQLGTLFGGFILGVIVTAVVTILIYRKLQFPKSKVEKPADMFGGNRAHGAASSDQISYTNDKKQNVAIVSPKETLGYNLSEKQENERSDDVYNHLHEQTEQNDDNYDHACAPLNHSTDLSDYN